MEPVNLLKPPLPRSSSRPPPATAPAAAKKFSFGTIEPAKAMRIGLFGPGGIGKTCEACRAPEPVAIFDFDGSLPVLKPSLGDLDIRLVEGVSSWSDFRDALHDKPMWKDIRSIVIDSATRAEQLAIAHTLANVKNEKNQAVTSIESYGYGKGFRHVFETFLPLLADLDQHVRDGRNVILSMHECTANVPNPDGEDFLRWEPRLQAQNNGNILLAVKEWLDHLLCIRFDIAVNESGKATGNGSRTIYPIESAVHMAKSRSLKDPIVYTEGSTELWNQLFR